MLCSFVVQVDGKKVTLLCHLEKSATKYFLKYWCPHVACNDEHFEFWWKLCVKNF